MARNPINHAGTDLLVKHCFYRLSSFNDVLMYSCQRLSSGNPVNQILIRLRCYTIWSLTCSLALTYLLTLVLMHAHIVEDGSNQKCGYRPLQHFCYWLLCSINLAEWRCPSHDTSPLSLCRELLHCNIAITERGQRAPRRQTGQATQTVVSRPYTNTCMFVSDMWLNMPIIDDSTHTSTVRLFTQRLCRLSLTSQNITGTIKECDTKLSPGRGPRTKENGKPLPQPAARVTTWIRLRTHIPHSEFLHFNAFSDTPGEKARGARNPADASPNREKLVKLVFHWSRLHSSDMAGWHHHWQYGRVSASITSKFLGSKYLFETPKQRKIDHAVKVFKS